MVTTRSAASAVGKSHCLVTGGSGFLGQHIVQQLLDTGKHEVTVFDVRPNDALSAKGVTVIVGDLRKPDDVKAACKGVDVVFHVATAAPTGTNSLNVALMESVNVQGTQNVVDACLAEGVTKLVYTSSASVVFDGRPLDKVDESCPYAAKPQDEYTRTKIDGEKLALKANCPALATVSLRPSGIFGEGDMVFVPTVAANARKGKMKFIIGSGENLMDFTYAGNVALAHLLAADKLAPGSAVAGKAYFVTNDTPVRFWDMMGDVCEGLGFARPSKKLPFLLILLIAMLFEHVIRPLLALLGVTLQSDFTVNRIYLSTTSRTFSCAAAKRDLGYAPKWSIPDAMERTLAAFTHLRADAVAAGAQKKQA